MKNQYFKDAVAFYKVKDYTNLKLTLDKLSAINLNTKDKILYEFLNKSIKNDSQIEQVNSAVCGQYYTYPKNESERFYEGGARIRNIKKNNLPDAPLVTVITVVFNNVKTIEQTIKSVISQTYKNIEYIVIDGGSSDGTIDILTKYEGDIDYLLSEKDSGIYNAMNKALSLASGSYICFLNADDYYLTYAIECSLGNIIEHKLDMSYGSFYYTDERGQVIVADEGRPWDDSMLIQGIPGGHETILASKEVYELNGQFNEKFKVVADYDWVIRAYTKGLRAAPLNKIILIMNTGGASFDSSNEYNENIELLKSNFGNLDDEFCDFLYSLKYYNNWYSFNIHDHELSRRFVEASNKSTLLKKALYKTVEARKKGCTGTIIPAEKKDPSKLKIAICLSFLNNVSGGAERIAIEQANRLQEDGHSVTLICCHGAPGEPYYPVNKSIPIIDLAVHPYNNQFFTAGSDFSVSEQLHGGRLFAELNFMPTESDYDDWNKSHQTWRCRVFKGFFKSNLFDVTISHMPSTYTYSMLADNDNAGLQVAVLHNSPTFKFYSNLYYAENSMERYMRLLALEKADAIGVLFPEFVEQMPSVYRDKCFVLPNFTNVNIVPHRVDSNKTIISVGRLVEQKDQKTLIKAYAKIKEIYKDWSLKIYGEGPLKMELTELCNNLGLYPQDILKGVSKDIKSIYNTSEIFVLPSLFEGFGLTIVEAMSYGLTVVAFDDCEGAKNLIYNGFDGILVNVNNGSRVDALFFELIKLIKNEEKRKILGCEAIKKVASFSIEENIKALMPVINRIDSAIPLVKKSKKINVAILTTYLEGGAGIAANRLKYALLEAGVNAVSVSFSPDRKVDYHMELPIDQAKIYDQCQLLNRKENLVEGGTYFSSSYPGLSFQQLDFLAQFDIINLHWVQNMLTNEDINFILSLNKPIVWTLHDMNPFTGGCHYSAGCQKFQFDCKSCPQMIGVYKNYPSLVLKNKKNIFKNSMNIVAPSRWMSSCAMKSNLFKNNPVHVISNSLNLSTFVPTGKYHARKYFELPLNKKILLFTCQSHVETRKGFRYLMELANLLDPDLYHILTLGNPSIELSSLPVGYNSLGHISEEWKIALGYSAADITLLPSLEDNLPNVILESLACGTPVVGFDNGGISDVVIDGVTGLLGTSGDVYKMLANVRLIDKENYSNSCRAYAVRHFGFTSQANAYLALFNSLLQQDLNLKDDLAIDKENISTFDKLLLK